MHLSSELFMPVLFVLHGYAGGGMSRMTPEL